MSELFMCFHKFEVGEPWERLLLFISQTYYKGLMTVYFSKIKFFILRYFFITDYISFLANNFCLFYLDAVSYHLQFRKSYMFLLTETFPIKLLCIGYKLDNTFCHQNRVYAQLYKIEFNLVKTCFLFFSNFSQLVFRH